MLIKNPEYIRALHQTLKIAYLSSDRALQELNFARASHLLRISYC